MSIICNLTDGIGEFHNISGVCVETKLTKRQLKSLVRTLVEEFEVHARGKGLSILSRNGCIAYRGGRTDPYCENISGEACRELDLRLKAENPNYHAVPLKNPCEPTS